jgi:hypothetical protein
MSGRSELRERLLLDRVRVAQVLRQLLVDGLGHGRRVTRCVTK